MYVKKTGYKLEFNHVARSTISFNFLGVHGYVKVGKKGDLHLWKFDNDGFLEKLCCSEQYAHVIIYNAKKWYRNNIPHILNK